ncbi:MAG: radical SAM protein [Vulcanimicrobiaceae bacterium]
MTPGRLWFYTNYHCNLACRYCLTESRPDAPRRLLDASTIDALAGEAVALGFTSFGVTGGEPFLRPDIPAILESLGRRAPTVVLTNGTLFGERALAQLRPLAALPIALQVSLDSADAARNDASRASGNFASVVGAIPRLRAAGLAVRIGSTVEGGDSDDLERLCALHRALGISDDDHVVRPVIRRGRARAAGLGVEVALEDMPAELTIAAEGAYWSPAAPTVRAGRLDTDFLLTRTIRPLALPLAAMQRFAASEPLHEPTGRVT